ncbi:MULTISPECIES: hypothetical protein [Photobacterium]|uniref:hypothetical protein n=1 Tax=Photobacterium TaxID=657 RepID=UPI00211031DF|nr:hypothetical protein [Photobacterium toruni]
MLIGIGIGLGGIIRGESFHKHVSLVANLVAIIGFALAVKAYLYWRYKDTVSAQTQMFRDILMILAEINLQIHRLLRQAYNLEKMNDIVEFPSEKQIDAYNEIDENIYKIQKLMIKYYAIEPNPNAHQKKTSKWDMVLLTFEGDCFANLKDYLLKLQKLDLYIRDNHKLVSKDGKIYSTQPNYINSDVGDRLGGAKNFHELYLYINSNANELEIELKRRIL